MTDWQRDVYTCAYTYEHVNSARCPFLHFTVAVCARLSALLFLTGAFEEINCMETTEASVFPV